MQRQAAQTSFVWKKRLFPQVSRFRVPHHPKKKNKSCGGWSFTETEKSYEKVDEILDFEQFSVTKMPSSSILYHFMLA